MAGSLSTASANLITKWYWSNTGPPAIVSSDKYDPGLSFGIGTGASNVNKISVTSYTIGAGGTQVVTLSSLLDPGGAAVAFTKVRLFVVAHQSKTNTAGLTIGPNTALHPVSGWWNGTTPTTTVRQGGAMILLATDATAYAVSSGSADAILITNSDGANAATVEVLVLGE